MDLRLIFNNHKFAPSNGKNDHFCGEFNDY